MTLYVRYVGSLEGATIRAARIEVQPLLAQLPYHLLLFDVTQLASISADGRFAIVERPPAGTSPLRGVAIVGASFHWRTIGTLMMRAATSLRTVIDAPMHFCDTAEQAREWLATRYLEITRKEVEDPEQA